MSHANDTTTAPSPTKAEIEALIASVRDGEPYPLWARMPGSEAEFLASLVLHAQRGDIDAPDLRIGYDDRDRAALVYGVRWKGDGPRAGLALTGTGAAA